MTHVDLNHNAFAVPSLVEARPMLKYGKKKVWYIKKKKNRSLDNKNNIMQNGATDGLAILFSVSFRATILGLLCLLIISLAYFLASQFWLMPDTAAMPNIYSIALMDMLRICGFSYWRIATNNSSVRSVRIYGVAIKGIDYCPDLFKSFLSDSSKKERGNKRVCNIKCV